MPLLPLPAALAQIDSDPAMVACRATDYPVGWEVLPHAHAKHQLIHAVHGVMSVRTDAGHWVVPPSRGLWMPAGMPHAIRCIAEVHMRSVFVQHRGCRRIAERSASHRCCAS